jgi:hypothetical protein
MNAFYLPISPQTSEEIDYLVKIARQSKRSYLTEFVSREIHRAAIKSVVREAIMESRELLESLKDK